MHKFENSFSANPAESPQLKELAREISEMHVKAAKEFLDEQDPLRTRIVEYYSERQETEQELIHVLGKQGAEGMEQYVKATKDFAADPVKFIERMERIFERQDVRGRRRVARNNERVATPDEYALGTYADFLESQVRDAVFAARQKGYLTFQSGFKESDGRSQFMDFYNKEITLPPEALKFLKSNNIVATVENLDDRTTLTLHPVGDRPVRLIVWKEIWDTLIKPLPQANPETVADTTQYEEHTDFRQYQDRLRKNLSN